MKRSWIYLYFILAYLLIPHKDVIKHYDYYGFTVNETQQTITHYKTGLDLTYISSYALFTVYFPTFDEETEPSHFVQYQKSLSGRIITTVGHKFEPPEEVNTLQMAMLFLGNDGLGIPRFTQMMQHTYFYYLLGGFFLIVGAPFIWYFDNITGKHSDPNEWYDDEVHGKACRTAGLVLIGISFLCYLYQRFF